MSRVLLKLRLILWKNLIIRKRHWLLTIFEIVIPVLLCIVNLFLTSIIPKPYIPETTYYNARDVKHFEGRIQLYYAPNYTEVDKFMSEVDARLTPHEFSK